MSEIFEKNDFDEEKMEMDYAAIEARIAEFANENDKRERQKHIDAEYRLADLLPADDDRTDMGQAKKFVKYADGRIAYTEQWGWMCYIKTESGGGVWKASISEVVELYKRFTDEQRQALFDSGLLRDNTTAQRAESISKFIRKYRGYAETRAVLALAESAVFVPVDAWDKDPYLLNVQNGVVNLRTTELIPSMPEQHMRHICSCNYVKDNPRGEKMWADTLDKIIVQEDGKTPDYDLQCYIQGIAGKCAIGNSYEEIFMCFSGGGSGKSTMWDTTSYVLGNYSVIIPPDLLVYDDKRGDTGASRFLNDLLCGARQALIGEIEQGKTLSRQAIKQVTPHDKMFADRKHRNPYWFRPTHTLVWHTNNMPNIPATDAGTWDRINIIPYNARIRGTKDDDTQYRDKLKAEASEAVLNWLVFGASSVLANGEKLERPQQVQSIIDKVRCNETVPESIRAFIEDCCVFDDVAQTSTKMLYACYAAFATDNDFEAVGATTFKRKLDEFYGITSRHTMNGAVYDGITAKMND